MYLYIEHNISDHPNTGAILSRFPGAQVTLCDNYKNLFDTNNGKAKSLPSCIIAKSPTQPVLQAPEGYGFSGAGYFFKTSLGCIYDCEYCYLKGMFKNDIPVYFVDYEYIQSHIEKLIQEERSQGDHENIWFYSSDYSDIQGMDVFSGFNETFIPFFEGFEHVMMETRTKSADIRSLLSLPTPSNTEIAYSLNPQEVIDAYEKGTASLDQRIKNINSLLDAGWKVGIRIMPLMPIENYESIYGGFIEDLVSRIDVKKLHSIFIGGLMFTKKDYQKMRKKGYLGSMLDKVDENSDSFVRLNQAYRLSFYQLFRKHFPRECEVCLDKKITLSDI